MQLADKLLKAVPEIDALLDLSSREFKIITNVLVRPQAFGYSAKQTKEMAFEIAHSCFVPEYLKAFLEKIPLADRAMVAVSLYQHAPTQFVAVDKFQVLEHYAERPIRKFPMIDELDSHRSTTLHSVTNGEWRRIAGVLCRPAQEGDSQALAEVLGRKIPHDEHLKLVYRQVPDVDKDCIMWVLYQAMDFGSPTNFINIVDYHSEAYQSIKAAIIQQYSDLQQDISFIQHITDEAKRKEFEVLVQADVRLLADPTACAAQLSRCAKQGVSLLRALDRLQQAKRQVPDFGDTQVHALFLEMPVKYRLAFVQACDVLVSEPQTLYPKFVYDMPLQSLTSKGVSDIITVNDILNAMTGCVQFINLPPVILSYVLQLFENPVRVYTETEVVKKIADKIVGLIHTLSDLDSMFGIFEKHYQLTFFNNDNAKNNLVATLWRYHPEVFKANSGYLLYLLGSARLGSAVYRQLKAEVVDNLHFLKDYMAFMGPFFPIEIREDCRLECNKVLLSLVENPEVCAQKLASISKMFLIVFLDLKNQGLLDDAKLMKLFEATAPKQQIAFLKGCYVLVQDRSVFYKTAAAKLSPECLALLTSGQVHFPGSEYCLLAGEAQTQLSVAPVAAPVTFRAPVSASEKQQPGLWPESDLTTQAYMSRFSGGAAYDYL